MTPVQLPEVPAIARFNVTGDYCYPTVDDPEGACVSYDDHVAQLREYATEAVMADRRRVLALAEKWRADVRDKYGFGPTGHATLAHAGELEALFNPSETNSD